MGHCCFGPQFNSFMMPPVNIFAHHCCPNNNFLNNLFAFSLFTRSMNSWVQPQQQNTPTRVIFQRPIFIEPPVINYNYPSFASDENSNDKKTNILLDIFNSEFKLVNKPKEPEKLNNSIKKKDGKFLAKVKQVAQSVNCDYRDLLAVMNSESTMNTKSGLNKKTGKIGSAVGLIQFTQIAIDELNKKYNLSLTKAKILNMSAIEQLDLTEKLLKMNKAAYLTSDARLNAADLYTLIFLPARVKKDVLCVSGEDYYEQNAGLDEDKDWKITKDDLAVHLDKKRVDESKFENFA